MLDNQELGAESHIILNAEIVNKNHDAILQTLDRVIGTEYFNSDAFKKNVNDWNGIPIIYAVDHPDSNLFYENPQVALAAIKGRIVGHITSSRIETVGHPRLMGNMEITDQEVNSFIDQGKLSHSTGFIGYINNQNLLTSVIPNHVLVFIEDAKNQPKDKGAFILNKSTEPYGNVEYADPGYQSDGVKRYPIDTEAHVRAAWSYINMPKNSDKYSADQLSKIKGKIESAAKKFGIEIHNKETKLEMANKDPTTEEINAMLDYMTKNPGKMDKGTMDKMYAAMDKANQKEYTKSMMKDLQSHPEMMDDEMKSIMKDMNINNKETLQMGKEDELSKQLEISNKEKETLTGEIVGLKKEIANKTEQLKVFEQKEATRLKTEEDSMWFKIKNKLTATGQGGLIHEAAGEALLKAQWVTNKDEFFMTHFVEKAPVKLPGKAGVEIQNLEDVDTPSKGADIGDYDPKTREWN